MAKKIIPIGDEAKPVCDLTHAEKHSKTINEKIEDLKVRAVCALLLAEAKFREVTFYKKRAKELRKQIAELYAELEGERIGLEATRDKLQQLRNEGDKILQNCKDADRG